MRVESAKPSGGSLGGWIHRLTDPLPARKPRPKQSTERIDWTETALRMFTARQAKAEREWLSEKLTLRIDALEEMLIGWGWDEYRNRPFSAWPERDAEGKVVGIVRRYRDGAKKTMEHSHHGLYYGRTPTVMPGPIFLPEGGSDTAALIGVGVNVIGRPSNTGGVDDLAAMLAKATKVIVVLGERDEKLDRKGTNCPADCAGCMWCFPGLAGAKQTVKRLAEKLNRAVALRMFPGAKDAREWLKQNPGATAPDILQVLA